MPIAEADVQTRLKGLTDPNTGRDFVSGKAVKKVSVSGADIVSGQGANASPVADPDLAPAAPFVRAFVDAGSTRIVWGSDWPHLFHFHGAAGQAAPATIFRPVDERALLRLVQEGTSADDRRRIFVDNPAALYDF